MHIQKPKQLLTIPQFGMEGVVSSYYNTIDNKSKKRTIACETVCTNIKKTELSITSGFPDDNMRTNDDFPTLGDPTRHSVGICRSTTGIERKA
jgi:hypothetical protein